MKIPLWPLVMLGLAGLVAVFGEPRAVALIVAGAAIVTAAFDMFRELDR